MNKDDRIRADVKCKIRNDLSSLDHVDCNKRLRIYFFYVHGGKTNVAILIFDKSMIYSKKKY